MPILKSEITKAVKDEDYSAYLMKNGVKFNYGSLVDERDGEIYCTVKIGSQTWMAENLRYVSVGGVADDDSGSFAYGEVEKNIGKFGRLYTWEAAMQVAPEGWRIPTDEDWDELCRYLSGAGDMLAGTMLKTADFWEERYGVASGSDSVGFAAVPSGGRYSMGYFYDLNTHAYFWTSSSMNHEYAKYRSISCRSGKIGSDYTYKTDAFAIRCVKNATEG